MPVCVPLILPISSRRAGFCVERKKKEKSRLNKTTETPGEHQIVVTTSTTASDAFRGVIKSAKDATIDIVPAVPAYPGASADVVQASLRAELGTPSLSWVNEEEFASLA